MATGKRYSAGAIFLQVVPVFADIQKSIEREVEDIDRTLGDQMEKSGKRAGARAGKAAGKEFGEGFGDEAEREMGAFERKLNSTLSKASKALGDSNRKNIRALKADLDRLKDMKIGVDISAEKALAQADALQRKLEHISRLDVDVDVDVRIDAGKAAAELMALSAAVERVDGKDIDIQVDVDSAAAERKLWSLSRSGDDAANSFRSFNAVIFAVASAGPALIPVLGALAGGLLAIGPAAAVAVGGLGAVLVGFSGVGEAVKALNAQQDAAAMTAQTAGKKEISSAKAVADARRSAARAIESALRRQSDAQKRYRDSIKDVKEAEQALKEAREAAKDRGPELDRDIRSNQLAIDQARIDSFNAQVRFTQTNQDGSATNLEKEQARIDREEARLALEELYAKQKELAKDKEKWDKEGVNGTKEVKSAQDRLLKAIEAQKKAYRDLGDASKDVDRARADGARQVAAAMDGQAAAAANLTAQQNAVNNAFENLSPAGREFALFLHGLQASFYRFRSDVQSVLLPAVQKAMDSFMGSRAAGVARNALIQLADSWGRFAVALSKSFQGQAWMGFFEMLGRMGPKIQDAYGSAFISFFEALASIMVTLAPYALRFANGLAKMMDSFAGWAASEKGQQSLRDFMDYAVRVAPMVLDFLGALARAAGAVARGLADWGEMTLGGITGFLDMIANMDPKLVSALAVGLTVVVTASQAAYAVMNLLMGAFALITSTTGLVVFGIIAIGAALVYLYKKNEDFRRFVNKAWKEISAAVKKAWKDDIQPALAELWDALKYLWTDLLQPIFAWLGPILVKFAKVYIPILGKQWAIMGRIVAIWIKAIVKGFKLLGSFLKWLWTKAFKPYLSNMRDGWQKFGSGVKKVWTNVLKPVFDTFKDKVLPKLKSAFKTVTEAIGSMWGGLKKIIAAPINFVIKTVLNDGIIAAFNKVAKFVGKDGIKPLKTIDTGGGGKAGQGASGGAGGIGMATGGILPGYTPGRDVHSFYSPSAGRLNLSGGEAIMRPEWTRAMGSEYVNKMNAIARTGGIAAIQRAMMGTQAFAKGGIIWPTTFKTLSPNYPGHTGVDINIPGAGDLGKPVMAVQSGTAHSRWAGGDSYGNLVTIQHPNGYTTYYGHLQYPGLGGQNRTMRVSQGQVIGNVGSTGNSSGPHLHFEVRPGSTREAALAYLGGAPMVGVGNIGAKAGGGGPSFPKWLRSVAKNPVGYFKDALSAPVEKMKSHFSGNAFADIISSVPGKLVSGLAKKAVSILPGGLADVATKVGGKVADGIGAVGDALGFADGGILPYNGTMMYDNGGYLPPGVTNVVNLTGKPEPVFTNKQWDNMGGGRPGSDGDTYHYEPHFDGSDLTAGEVAADMNHGFRRLRHEGKYKGL